MTVSTTSNKNTATGDGVQTVFVFTFAAQQGSDIDVYKDGVLVVSGYTVAINSNGVGGTITFSVAPANLAELLFKRLVDLTQGAALPIEGNMPESTLERAYDKLCMADQQQQEEIDRAVKRSGTSDSTADLTLPEPEARRAVLWNAAGDGFENSDYDPDEQQDNAADSAAAAAVSEANAAASASAANLSAVDAAVSATLAADWATKTTGIVAATDYSAKEFAQGSQASTGGSAKNWATQTGGDVTGAAANSRSAKAYAQDVLNGPTLGGSAKDWAQKAHASTVDGSGYSAMHWAIEAQGYASAINLPSATGHGGQLIRQNLTETGFEYRTNAQIGTQLVPFLLVASSKSSGFSPAAADCGTWYRCTSALTITPVASATLGAGWFCKIDNASTGLVVIDANSTELIYAAGQMVSGGQTLTLFPGESCTLFSTGTALWAEGLSPPGSSVIIKDLGFSASQYFTFEDGVNDVVFNSMFNLYQFHGRGLRPVTDNVDLSFQVKTGGSFQTSSYAFAAAGFVTGTANNQSASAAAASILGASGIAMGNAAGETVSFRAQIEDPAGTSLYKVMGATVYMVNQAGSASPNISSGHYGSNAAITGVRWGTGSGNWAAGNIMLIGIRKAG